MGAVGKPEEDHAARMYFWGERQARGFIGFELVDVDAAAIGVDEQPAVRRDSSVKDRYFLGVRGELAESGFWSWVRTSPQPPATCDHDRERDEPDRPAELSQVIPSAGDMLGNGVTRSDCLEGSLHFARPLVSFSGGFGQAARDHALQRSRDVRRQRRREIV